MPAPRPGKSFAISGRAIFAPTSPRSAGRHFARGWRRRRQVGARRALRARSARPHLPASGRRQIVALHRHRDADAEGAAGSPARACASKACISRTMRVRSWAGCRTAISTTSRCRPTGTRAIACSRRRASTRSPISNGASPRSQRPPTATSSSRRGSRRRRAPIVKTLRFHAGKPQHRFRSHLRLAGLGAAARCGSATSRFCPRRSIGTGFS